MNEALTAVARQTARANEYTQEMAPWQLAKDPAKRAELEQALASLIRRIARQAIQLLPFMPEKVAELWQQLGAPIDIASVRFSDFESLNPSGWTVSKGAILFPRPVALPVTPGA